MDVEDWAPFVIILFFIASPFLLLLSIFSCIAYSRTKKWEKERAARFRNRSLDDIEGEALVCRDASNRDGLDGDDNPMSDVDSLDTEEDAQMRAEVAEREADWNLTKGQKFRKELKECWNGRSPSDLQKEKEREDAKKIAKAVAKGIERHERRRERRARKAEASGSGHADQSSSSVLTEDASGLPSYSNAVAASDQKA